MGKKTKVPTKVAKAAERKIDPALMPPPLRPRRKRGGFMQQYYHMDTVMFLKSCEAVGVRVCTGGTSASRMAQIYFRETLLHNLLQD